MEAPKWLTQLQADFSESIRRPLLIDEDGFRCQYEAYASNAVAAMLERENQTGFERLSTYNQQYWFRLLGVLQNEYPLLCALVGVREFNRLATAALDRYPSTHPELHFLPEHLVRFLATQTPWSTPRYQLAARVDFAYFSAFLAEKYQDLRHSPITPENASLLLTQPLRFQGSWTLIREDFNAVETRKALLEAKASDARTELSQQSSSWVIYRGLTGVTEEKIGELEANLLHKLSTGEPLATACDHLQQNLSESEIAYLTEHIQSWFQRWAQLGWFAAPKD